MTFGTITTTASSTTTTTSPTTKTATTTAAKMNCYFLFENLCEDFIFSAKKSLAKFNGTPFVKGHPS